jgi:RNA polymerase sigma factor (sigma-70 family)
LWSYDGDGVADKTPKQLVEENLGLAFHRGERFFKEHWLGYRYGSQVDAQQEAVFGLMAAADSYKPEKGPFAGWASLLIDQHLAKAATKAGPVNVSYSAGLAKPSATPKAIARAQKALHAQPLVGLDIAAVLESGDDAEAIQHALFTISPDLFVLLHRYGFGTGDPETLEQVAKLVGMTRERIRQIQKHALAEMRRIMEK